MMGGMGGFGMGFGWLIPLLVIGALVWLAVSLLRRDAPHRADSDEPAADDALGILRERYARGEISREEFDTMRRDIA